MPTAALHRRLQQATRDVVFASPRMRAEYRRRHRWWLVPYLAIATVIALLIAMFLPLLLSLLALLDPAIRAEMFRHPLGDGPTPEPLARFRPLAIIAPLWLMLWLLLVPNLRNYLWCGLCRISIYWPLSDAQLTRGGWTRTYGLGALIFVGTAAWGWALSLAMELEQREWLLLMGLAALHAWLMVALTWLMAALVPRRLVSGFALAAILLMFGGTPAIIYLSEFVGPYPELARQWELLAFLLPTGWVCGTINYAVLEHNPLGWLFLLPVAAVSLWAIVWRTRGLRLLEFIIGFNGSCQPVFDRGFRDDREFGWQLPSSPPAESPAQETNAEQVRERVTKRILSGALWESFQWPTHGFIERWVGRLLTDREQRALIFLGGGRPWWTQAWRMSWCLCLLALGIEQACALYYGRHFFLLAIVMVGMFAVAEIWSWARQPAGGSLHPLFPVSRSSLLLAVAKMLVVRVPLGVVSLGMLLLLSAWGEREYLATTLRVLLIVCAIAPGLTLSTICGMLVGGVRSPWVQGVHFLFLLPCLLSSVIGIVASVSWEATLLFVPLYVAGVTVCLAILIVSNQRLNWDCTDRLPPVTSPQR